MESSSGKTDEGSTAKAIAETKWPEATPKEEEEHFVSIVCGNSHLNWALHNSVKHELKPALFWRTPHLKSVDVEGDATYGLSRHLPQMVHDYVFGKDTSPTKAAAQEAGKNRANLKVFLVSAVQEQCTLLCEMWDCVPSEVYLMKGDDFFTVSQGRYDAMGVDRVAALRGAEELHGAPALVFDGGTATTYAATNSEGCIIGGGIGPGFKTKFQSLSTSTDALPNVTPEEVLDRVREAIENKNPLQTFSKTTKDSIIVDVISEFATNTRRVISQWMNIVGKPESKSKPDKMQRRNRLRNILVTGGDGEILCQLLVKKTGGVIHSSPGPNDDPLVKEYPVIHQKHLIHYGIASALMKQVQIQKMGHEDIQKMKKLEEELEENAELIGQRVAKKFDVADDDGDFIFRGTITKIQRPEEHKDDSGETFYFLQYDDGDQEHVTSVELQGLLKLFQEHGEKSTDKKKSKISKKEEPKKTPKTGSGSAIAEVVKGEEPKKTPAKRGRPKSTETPVKKPTDTPAKRGRPPSTASSASKTPEKKTAAPAPKRARTSTGSAAKAVTPTTTPKTKKQPKTPMVVDIKKDPKSCINTRVSKKFGKEFFYGTIISYDIEEGEGFWKVTYDDGDEEEYDEKDMNKGLKLYNKMKDCDPNPIKEDKSEPEPMDVDTPEPSKEEKKADELSEKKDTAETSEPTKDEKPLEKPKEDENKTEPENKPEPEKKTETEKEKKTLEPEKKSEPEKEEKKPEPESDKPESDKPEKDAKAPQDSGDDKEKKDDEKLTNLLV